MKRLQVLSKQFLLCVLVLLLLPLYACSQSSQLSAEQISLYQSIIENSSDVLAKDYPLVNSEDKVVSESIEFMSVQGFSNKNFKNAIIVLGNMPLDESTPTVDMVYRVLKAIDVFNENNDSVIFMTGGKTVGNISEAEMMGVIAWSRGVKPTSIFLEDKARTTAENAEFTARLLKGHSIDNVYIISKKEHLDWAIPYFNKYENFKNVQGVGCGVSFNLIVSQMEEYLKVKNSSMVRKRLYNLKNEIKGID